MRDPGLEEAVRAVGGVSELARQIGISQPSVSNWNRIPAERVLIVEAATGVDRKMLRPDLYGPAGTKPASDRRRRRRARAGIRAARHAAGARAGCKAAGEPRRLARRRDAARRRACRARAGRQRNHGRARSSASSSTCSSGSAAANCCPTPPTISPASCTSARWRGCAATWPRSASSAPKAITSPKITPRRCARSWRAWSSGRLPAPQGTDQQIFEKHLAPWIGRFFADLERAEAANLYRRIGTLGRVFIEVETEAFALPS